MNVWKKAASLSLAFLLVLGGCSMGKKDDSNNGNANATDTKQPQSNTANSAGETMDRMISYLQDQGMELQDMTDIDQMDFAAHEGKSFSYRGSAMYLYRLKSDDQSMQA